MASRIPKDVLALLIAVGSASDPDGREVESRCQPLLQARKCASMHWRDWDDACDGLSVEEHVALLKGVTLAERHAGWQGGSVSPIIWAFRRLEPRVPIQATQDLAAWVMARSRNPYAPFGSTVLARHFRPNEDLRGWSGTLSNLLHSRRTADHRVRAEEHDRRTQAAKAERVEKRAKEALLHGERKGQRDSARAALVAKGEGLDAIGRLRIVAEQTEVPLLAFPPEWADVEEGLLSAESGEWLAQLEARVRGMTRGPWSKLFLKLSAVRQGP